VKPRTKDPMAVLGIAYLVAVAIAMIVCAWGMMQ
jgi:hypothetical protein